MKANRSWIVVAAGVASAVGLVSLMVRKRLKGSLVNRARVILHEKIEEPEQDTVGQVFDGLLIFIPLMAAIGAITSLPFMATSVFAWNIIISPLLSISGVEWWHAWIGQSTVAALVTFFVVSNAGDWPELSALP